MTRFPGALFARRVGALFARRVGALLSALVLVSTVACSSGGGSGSGTTSGGSPSGSRGEVIPDLVNNTIVPRYQALQAPMEKLLATVEALCAAPDETNLTSARAALRDARFAWKSLEAMWAGPVRVRRSWTLMDNPITPEDIDNLLASATPPTVDIGYMTERAGSDQRGLCVIEYVLGPDESSLGSLVGRTCDYLVSIATVVRDHAALLGRDWTEDFNGNPPYRDLFIDPDNPKNFDTLITDVYYLFPEMTVDELGMALGVVSDPNPAAIIEGYGGMGVVDLQARVAGIRVVLLGDDASKGVAPLLGDDLTTRLRAQLDGADQALAAVKPPLLQALSIYRDDVMNARAAIQSLEVTVATEVISKLGVTLGFRGADGDGGG